MDEKLFSVFLGTYNAEPWIEKIIDSLEKQTCKPFDVFIIDNGSTDNTLDKIDKLFNSHEFKNKYVLIKNEKNIGPMSTFLERLDVFNSKWVFMAHQDDYYHEDHFQVLAEEVQQANAQTSVVFTAMKRMDSEGKETLPTPTLSSKLSEVDRFSNFLLTLQINPINFPSCALRVSELRKTQTNRHSTAFNDTEMLLRMICISDVKYVQKETMHYRVHGGNASSITNNRSNDYAVFIGLVELFHSNEFNNLVPDDLPEEKVQLLIEAVDSGVNIRIQNEYLQNLTKGIIAEVFIRKFSYNSKTASNFLASAHVNLDLKKELEVINSIKFAKNYEMSELNRASENPNFNLRINQTVKPNLHVKFINSISLINRDKIYNFLIRHLLIKLSKRPFFSVWAKSKAN